MKQTRTHNDSTHPYTYYSSMTDCLVLSIRTAHSRVHLEQVAAPRLAYLPSARQTYYVDLDLSALANFWVDRGA